MSRISNKKYCDNLLDTYHNACEFTKEEVGTFSYDKPYKIVDLYKIFYLISENNLDKTTNCVILRSKYTEECVLKENRDYNHEYFINMLRYTLKLNNKLKEQIDYNDVLHNLYAIVKHMNLNYKAPIDYGDEYKKKKVKQIEKKIDFEDLYLTNLEESIIDKIRILARNKNKKGLDDIKTYNLQIEIKGVGEALSKILRYCDIININADLKKIDLCINIQEEVEKIEQKLFEIEAYNEEKFEDLKLITYKKIFDAFYPPKSPTSPRFTQSSSSSNNSKSKSRRRLEFKEKQKKERKEDEEALEEALQLSSQELSSSQELLSSQELSSSQETSSQEFQKEELEQIEDQKISKQQESIDEQINIESIKKNVRTYYNNYYEKHILNRVIISRLIQIFNNNKKEDAEYFFNMGVTKGLNSIKFDVNIDKYDIETNLEKFNNYKQKLNEYFEKNEQERFYILFQTIMSYLQKNIIDIFDYIWSENEKQKINCEAQILTCLSFFNFNNRTEEEIKNKTDTLKIFYLFLDEYLSMGLIDTQNFKKINTKFKDQYHEKYEFIKRTILRFDEKLISFIKNEEINKHINSIINSYDLIDLIINFDADANVDSIVLKKYIKNLEKTYKYYLPSVSTITPNYYEKRQYPLVINLFTIKSYATLILANNSSDIDTYLLENILSFMIFNYDNEDVYKENIDYMYKILPQLKIFVKNFEELFEENIKGHKQSKDSYQEKIKALDTLYTIKYFISRYKTKDYIK